MGKITLNSAQQEVVDHKDGPMLVVAGAGTGKTRVIVERIVKLIEEGVDPHSIVALTFTEKAAQEMLDRINESRGMYSLDLNVHTYNAFGEKLLRKYGIDVGLQPELQLLNETSMAIFVREHLDEFTLKYYRPIGDPGGYIKALLAHFSSLKQSYITPEEYREAVQSLEEDDQLRHTELCEAYQTYIDLCAREGVIDYDDQIFQTVTILKQRPNIRARLQKDYKYLLVDEFQDTNVMQSQLLQILAETHKNIMVVGDDDQAIYGFRGADITNILEFSDIYPKAKQVVLTQNYRSTQQILDSAYTLINNNNPNRLEIQNKLNKKLTSDASGSEPTVTQFDSITDELLWIAEDIRAKINEGVEPQEIAVLIRTNALAQKLSSSLGYAGVPNHITGQTHDLFSETVIQAIIHVLQTLDDPKDSSKLYYALSGEVIDAYSYELSEAAAESRKEHSSLLEYIESDESLAEGYKKPLELLQNLRKKSSSSSIGELVYRVIEDSGLKQTLVEASDDDPIAAHKIFYISQLFDVISDYESSTTDKTLRGFLANYQLLSIFGQNISDDSNFEDGEGVSIMTIHKSKGLEWEHVYIPNLVQGTFPSINRSSSLDLPEALSKKLDREQFIAEERRLMYVAMTRARTNLQLSMSLDHGGKTKKRPSVFIAEALGDEALGQPQSVDGSHKLNIETKSVDVDISSLPKNLLKNGWLNLSVSQINDYQRCPADFYYRHILHVPEEPSSASGVGKIIHSAVQYFNEDLLSAIKPEITKHLKRVEKSWPKIGFSSAQERQESLDRALSSLKIYFENRLTDERTPNIIEKGFELKLEEQKILIRGRYDAVYNYPDYVEIRDYKTSQKNRDEKTASRSASASPQLTIYALAWQEMNGSIPDKLTLDFLLDNAVGSVSKRQQSLDTMKAKIIDNAQAIRNLEFPYGNDHTYCRH